MGRSALVWGVAFFLLVLAPYPAKAALIDQVNRAYREAHGKNPTVGAWGYWAGRVQRKEKRNYQELVGAMFYQKAAGKTVASAGKTVGTSLSSSAAITKDFSVDRKFYPSSHNPNFLPDGTLVKSPTSPEVYYIRNGKKSWILPSVVNRWLGENHYYKRDIILTISAADLARYPQVTSVNPIYIGKVLRHPNGTQYFIDDKLRKRKLPGSIRSALKIPGGNLYPTSSVHLREFRTGPTLTDTRLYPGGMVVYSGPYHGGKIWRIKESAGGKLTKHLYLSDYLYEADGNPDESMRAAADPARLARHTRGSNVDKYPDGWVVGLNNNIYVVESGKLRLITTPRIFAALGYKQKYVLKVFPKFLKRYPHGQPIRAFKSVMASGSAKNRGAPKAAPSTASNLTKVRPRIRTLINQINDLYLAAYDKEPTTGENKFWVDYVYNGRSEEHTSELQSH